MRIISAGVAIALAVALAGCDLDGRGGEAQDAADKRFDKAADKHKHKNEQPAPAPVTETPAPDVLCELGVVYSSVQCRDALEQACHDQGGHPLVGSSIVTCLYD